MSVVIWNFFDNTAIEPIIELDKNYSSIKFNSYSGKLLQDKVLLSNIPPFSFIAFEEPNKNYCHIIDDMLLNILILEK